MLAKNGAAKAKAAVPQFTFTAEGAKTAAKTEAAVTKPIDVHFDSGSAKLNKRAESTIDDEMAPLIESNSAAYFEVSGNTDSTGSRDANMRLSETRAKAVVDYLVREWEFPRERFVVKGNGPDAPICDEKDPGADGLSLEECRSANRTTRAAVLVR